MAPPPGGVNLPAAPGNQGRLMWLEHRPLAEVSASVRGGGILFPHPLFGTFIYDSGRGGGILPPHPPPIYVTAYYRSDVPT